MECVRCVSVWLKAGWDVRGEKIGFGLYQSCGNSGSVGCASVFGLRWCGWCWGGGGSVCVDCARVWEGGVLLCLCVLIICVYGGSRYLYIVLGVYRRILGAPSVQSCCTI